MTSQYQLDISLPVAYSEAQFLRSQSNEIAYGWIARWPDWPENALYLQGEAGAGKTHLAHVFKNRAQAEFLDKDSLSLPPCATIVDNVETWKNEEALFHLFNHCKAQNIPLLLTSVLIPDHLPFALPDLRSRLKSLSVATITLPDDALLEALLFKQLGDRQLKIAPEVAAYMLPRLPRSFAGVATLIERLDHDSLGSGRALTIPFVRQYL